MLRDGLRGLSESLLSTSSGGSSSEKLTLGDVGEPPPGSPPQRRRCRDVACLAFFALYWVGMLLVSAQAYYEGDLRRLYSGYDSDDNLCGIDDSVRHAPFVYFPCLQYGGRHPTVCMPRCPAISAHYVRWYNGSQIMCPTASRSLHKIPATTYPTANLLHNCVPGAPSLYAVVADRIDQSAFTSVLAGLFRAWHVVLLAAAAAAALALLWAACIRAMCRARAMAVSTVLVAVASLALLAAALWVRAFYLSSAAFADEHPIFLGSLEVAINTDMSLVLALVTTVFAVSVAVALWCGLLHRLLEGGGIIAEAAEAVAAMPALLLVIPPVVSVLLVGLFFFWGYVALLIATAGTPVKGELAYDRPLQWLLILHAAGVLWSAEALLHVGCCATSAVVVRWYFASIDCAAPLGSRRTVAALGRAAGKCLRYSSGSVVLGAVLMIPGRIFRFFLEHCLHQTQINAKGKPELRGIAQCCLRCCLDGSTRWVQYASHNAYVLLSVHDLPFCEGARQAFELTMRNIGRVSLLTAGERLLLTLAKLAVACVSTAGAALMMSAGSLGPMDNPNGALLLCFCVCFCVADAFIGVFDAAVETIFLCYLVDHEENDGDVRPHYASPALLKYMGKHRPSYRIPDEEEEAAITADAAADEFGGGDGSRSGSSGSLAASTASTSAF